MPAPTRTSRASPPPWSGTANETGADLTTPGFKGWTEADVAAFIARGAKVSGPPVAQPVKRRHKYGAQATVVDGIRFPSKREADRYSAIKLAHATGAKGPHGRITLFCRQPRFVLEGGEYVADFLVAYEDGSIEVLDAKGFATPVYRQKKRQMLERYGIEVVEI